MYTLYYLNKNLQIRTIKTATLDMPILIPEDLIFCDLRKGIHFIKEPHECIDFTDLERLFMQSEFNDINIISEGEYRKQNTYLSPLCQIDAPLFNPETFDFEAYTWKVEGALKLAFKTCDVSALQAKFSLDGVTYTHTFDFDYWYSEAGQEELGGLEIYYDDGTFFHASIYLDPAFPTEWFYNTVPDFTKVYFVNKITGKQSDIYKIGD